MSDPNTNLIAKLDELSDQYAALGDELNDPAVIADHKAATRISVKRAALAGIVEKYARYKRQRDDLQEAQLIVADGSDAEMVAFAREQIDEIGQAKFSA